MWVLGILTEETVTEIKCVYTCIYLARRRGLKYD